MGMASGRATYILAWENGGPKAPETFFLACRKFFHQMCLDSKCSDSCGEFKDG